MPKGSLNVSLKGADDIFSTEESRQEQQREQVQQIPIGKLFPFKNHPFKVLDDESMQRTVESVEQYGVLSPLITRPRPEGGYEIISGHRRQHAAQLAGLETLPVIVRNMDDDAAVLLMVDSNLQRENILPSERAFAYKMKLEALKNQGARSDLTCGQIGHKLNGAKARDIVADESGDNARNVQRFIRLTNLIPELLDMVKNTEMKKGVNALMKNKIIGVCPNCGANVVEREKGWFCENRECRFVLWKDNAFFKRLGKRLDAHAADKLLRDGRVRLKDCRSAKGKAYNATVLLSTEPDGRSKFSLEFEGGC